MNAKLLILLFLLARLLTVYATAQVNYLVSGNIAYVWRSPNASGDVVISSTYNGYPVTYIADEAFIGTEITSVTIPNSVTSIGWNVFYGCSYLTSVTLPNGMTELGRYAFSYCRSLTNVTIPASVTEIGVAPFLGCTNLTSVAIPNNVTTIGFQAFAYCTSLKNVTIPNSVAVIGGYAFSYCANLTNVTFLGNAPSDGVTSFNEVGPGAKIYYYFGTTGWGTTYAGLPAVMLGAPASQVDAASAGMNPGGFGFTIVGVANQPVVVEASTNLTNWQPIWNRTLLSASTNFVDPLWLNYPRRYYRLQSN